MYRSIPKPPMPPPRGGKPRGIWLFWKILVKFPAMLPVYTVKCPTRLSFKESQIPHPPGMLKQLWNKFCKIFSHYEFHVQLVFAPHFKQRHIPRYNYIKRQQQKNPRGIDKSNDPWTRLTCWIKELRNPLVSDRWQTFGTKVKCPTGRASF